MRPPLPESILVVRLGAIGDVTNALVFATAVRDAAPDVRIGWAVHPLAEPLVRDHPSVDVVHVLPRRPGPRGWARAVRALRAERYAAAVDLQRLQKSALLARASRAPRVIGYDRRWTKELSHLWTNERVAAPPGRRHMVERYLDVARHLGLADARARHVLPDDPDAARWAREAVAGLPGPPVLVNLGASKPENRWPAERFGALAAALLARGVPVVLTGGPDDRAAARVACELAPGALDLAGATSLRQLYHLMDHARLFVGCDTGPMHLAVARGAAVVAIFGPADPLRTGPWTSPSGPEHRVVRRPALEPGELLPVGTGPQGGGSPERSGPAPAPPFAPALTRDVQVDDVLEACAPWLSAS